MKNASKHAQNLRSLYKSLTREGEPPPPPQVEPLHALVRGAMTSDVSDAKAEDAMRTIDREFVDLNELRVATELEVQELLGVRYPAIEDRVMLITHALNGIFEKEHTLSLDRLKTVSKRDARQYIRDLPGMNPFVEAYIMLHSFECPAVPVDQQTVEYLREEGILSDAATHEEAQRFLEHHLKETECYEFYSTLRKAMYDEKRRKKK